MKRTPRSHSGSNKRTVQRSQPVQGDAVQRMKAERAMTQAATELAGRELLLQQILDTSSVAIFRVNMLGRITHVNQRMVDMFGWSQTELVGKDYVELVDPLERSISRKLTQQLLGGHVPSTDVERLYRKADGSDFWGHLSGRRFVDAHGRNLGLVGVLADVTERKRADQRQQHHNRILKMLAEKAPLSGVLDAMVRRPTWHCPTRRPLMVLKSAWVWGLVAQRRSPVNLPLWKTLRTTRGGRLLRSWRARPIWAPAGRSLFCLRKARCWARLPFTTARPVGRRSGI